jgi:DNA-binding response OmpR family regulator
MHHEMLIVEDDYAFRWALAMRCSKSGIEADVAENGREALDLLQRKIDKYCCVILDLRVPQPTGPDIVESLATHPAPPSVLVVTAHPDLAARVENAPVVADTLLKPVDVVDVVNAAVSHCRHAQPAA